MHAATFLSRVDRHHSVYFLPVGGLIALALRALW